jgi:riboflavin synthase
MFTGIIKEVGTVKEIKEAKASKIFTIECKIALENKAVDESIAVNGVCVTITDLSSTGFTFTAIQETLEKSNLGKIEEGAKVNLEPALTLKQGIDGHLVQGHVDETASVKSYQNGKLEIKTPRNLTQYIAYKGSITINGVSLTVSRLEDSSFTVELIPHTMKNTNLGKIKEGDKVNLEIDMIARYLESLLNQKEKESKYEFLKDRNLI